MHLIRLYQGLGQPLMMVVGKPQPSGTMRRSFLLSLLLLLTSCQESDGLPALKIVTNSWIGYAPLYYARQTRQLEPLGIKLVTVVSLGESLMLYRSGVADAFTGTQYEFSEARRREPSVVPVLLLDRSNGGDMVLANRSLEQLRNTQQPIDVYLEVGSVNTLVLQDFLKARRLEHLHLRYINQDQGRISTLQAGQLAGPALVVTYFPYSESLLARGFQKLASTRDSPDLLVVDALYTTRDRLRKNRQRLKQLKSVIDNAIRVAQRDPEGFYRVVADFLGDPGLDAFRRGMRGIEWIGGRQDEALQKRLEHAGFPTEGLL